MIKWKCKNCEQDFEGNFCNHCGQSSNTKDINFSSVFYEIQSAILQIDKGILFTTKELLIRPGNTIREYIYGKRVKHFKPFAYILLLSTIYILLAQYSHKTTFWEEIFQGMTDSSTEISKDNSTGRTNLFVEILQWMKNNYAYTTILTIPIISLASYWSFYKAKYNYFQHLILHAYMAGQRTAIYLILIPIIYFISDQTMKDVFDVIKMIIGFLLNFWTYFQFFDKTKPFKKIVLIGLTYLLISIIFLIIIVLIMVVSEAQK
ncbi:MAG: DUF3667 domain-containing protein [Saprospiraceae bacterium]|nr:DUF3667 domain-containing protein [Saprospiraceae bacterium]